MSEKQNFSEIPDSKWICAYMRKPEEGQVVASKKKGDGKAYHGHTPFIDGCFETAEDLGNRIVITRWKHDLWLPLKEDKLQASE